MRNKQKQRKHYEKVLAALKQEQKTIHQMLEGVYDAKETVKRLKTEVLNDQWTFHTDRMLSYLRFSEYKEVEGVKTIHMGALL